MQVIRSVLELGHNAYRFWAWRQRVLMFSRMLRLFVACSPTVIFLCQSVI